MRRWAYSYSNGFGQNHGGPMYGPSGLIYGQSVPRPGPSYPRSELSNYLETYSSYGIPSMNEERSAAMSNFDETLLSFMSEQQIPGASFVLTLHGKLIYRQGYGVAGPSRRVTSTSSFRIASITKPITAIAVMKAIEEGKITLDQKVFHNRGILSDFKPQPSLKKSLGRITVRDLLQHSGGWDREEDCDVVFLPQTEIKGDLPHDESLTHYMMQKKLQFQPGKRHAYSNFGYLVLGLILEKIYKTNYSTIIHHLLQPFGVGELHVGQEERKLSSYNEVEYFEREASSVVDHVIMPESTTCQPQYGGLRMRNGVAYGGLVATPQQLLEIFQHLDLSVECSNRILNPDIIKEMLACPVYEDGEDWYGLGLDVQDRGQSWGHTGSMDGSSGTYYHHKSGLTWVLLFNACSRDTDIDGVIKFGLSRVCCLSIYCDLSLVYAPMDSEINVISDDREQVVQVMLPFQIFHDNYDRFTDLGYMATCIDMFTVTGDYLYCNIIWLKAKLNNTTQAVYSKVPILDIISSKTCIPFIAEINDKLGKGWKVLHTSTCVVKGSFIIMIVLSLNQNQSSQQIISIDSVPLEISKCKIPLGFDIFFISVSVFKEHKFILKVLEKKKRRKNIVLLDMTTVSFVKELRKNGLMKKGLMSCNFYNVKGKTCVSAVWSLSKTKNCFQRFGVSRYSFLHEVVEGARKNRYKDMVSAYVVDGVINFAGFWSAGHF